MKKNRFHGNQNRSRNSRLFAEEYKKMEEQKKKEEHEMQDYLKPADAMFEHNKEKSMAINRQIVTKTGLPTYTEKECKEMSGEVICSRVCEPITWEEFKAYTDAEKIAWIEAMLKRYKGISIKAIVEMWNGEHYFVLQKYMKDHNITFAKNQPFEDKAKYEEEILSKITRVPKMSVEEELKTIIIPPKEEPKLKTGFLNYCELICDAEEVGAIFTQLGFKGKISIQVRSINESIPESV